MRITKRRLRVASAVMMLAAVVGAFAWHYGWSSAVVPPADNAYVGVSREQIIDRLGMPDSRSPGHYGNPPLQWAKQYDPCETLTYSKWNGTLYISVYQKDGEWVCFCSNWLGKGGVF